MLKPMLQYLESNLAGVSPMLTPMIDMMNKITVEEILKICDGETASQNVLPLCQKIVSFGGMMQIGLKSLFKKFYEGATGNKDIDLIESNMRYVLSSNFIPKFFFKLLEMSAKKFYPNLFGPIVEKYFVDIEFYICFWDCHEISLYEM
jgi:hypothetical protein